MNTLALDHFTIIASSVLILLSILTPMLNPLFRFKKQQALHQNSIEGPIVAPPLSLILTPLDNADLLAKNLPLLIRQNYPSGYQVVIVIEQGDHEAESIIGQVLDNTDLSNCHADIYITHIPLSSRYISKKRLAMTLGIKAAKHAWILPTEASCRPASEHWLTNMARHCNETNNLIIGYGCYDNDTSSFRRFERLHSSFYLMREHIKTTSYRTNSYNLLLRKSEFMAQDGFLGNLHLMRGEYDFLVNKYAKKHSTALEVGDEAWLIEDKPSDKTWLNKHLFYMESRKFLARSAPHRFLFCIDQAALHLNYLLLIAAACYAALTANLLLLGTAAVALVVTLTFRGLLCRRAINDFAENISIAQALFYETAIAWQRLHYMLKFRMADKYDFTTHKL